MNKAIILLSLLVSLSAYAKRVDIWPSIPFVRGADLCRYSDAYGQTRNEYMRKMTNLASELMYSGALGFEALEMLTNFNNLYDRNISIATQHKYLDVTLENTLRAYLDEYYRTLRPMRRNISFTHMNHIRDIIGAINNGQRIGNISDYALNELDYIAYGSYAFAPNCRGNIQVTLTLVGRNGETKNYIGNGKPSVVMSQIASKIFEDFQKTTFPSNIQVNGRTLTLLGGIDGDINTASSPRIAQTICESMGARLPREMEYEIIDSYGSWSGGISISDSHRAWAMSNDYVFHPDLRNPTPVRRRHAVNDRTFMYICVK